MYRNRKLSNFIEFNPAESLTIGEIAKKIPMEKLIPYRRDISGYEKCIYSSGPKFRNGDTLVAKITPCLENGKTALVNILEENEVAFGSSEFIVLRAIQNREKEEDNTDPMFLYYLSTSPNFRKRAISCMEGTSGRKRVVEGTLKNHTLLVPDYKEQQQIATVLSAIDNKIRLNKTINHNLEAMAKQLYDYWFVQFDFPNEEGKPYKSNGGKMVWNDKLKREIPKDWDNCTLEYFLTIRNGREHKLLADGIYPVYGSGGEMRRVDDFLYNGESVLMPRKGSLNNIMYINDAFWTVDTMFYSEMKQPHCAKFVFYSIKDIDFTRWNSGTGVPSMTSSTLYSILLVKPSKKTLQLFDGIVAPLFRQMKQIEIQNVELTKQRDKLLPLLMNGQVSVNYDLSSY